MNQSWKTQLRDRTRGKTRVAVLGIGSELRADDGAGILAASGILAKSPDAAVFLGHTAPENLTGEIIRYKPDCLIMVDALDCGREPGFILVADRNLEEAESPFPTHKMPFKLLADYLERNTGCDVVVIGIQPECLEFDGRVTPAVRRSANAVAAELAKGRQVTAAGRRISDAV